MPVDFADSETLKNLMRAFAGESQARSRYTFAAAQCRSQGLHVLEAVFQFTANQEKEHAEIFYRHMQSFAGGTVHMDGGYPVDLSEDPLVLLRRARHGEYQEHREVYPAFAETARQEGFDDVARSFRLIAAIEQTHGDRFGALADLLEQDKLFAGGQGQGWLCLNCGHIHQGPAAPAACPVCGHDRGFFLRLEAAPFGIPGGR